MVATQYLSDHQIFTNGVHGVASKHPRLKELMLSEHLMPHNILFQCSAAFWFHTSSGAADAVTTSLWNGLDDAAHATLGQALCVFDPGFAEPSGALLKGVVPIITLTNALATDARLGSVVFTQVESFSTQAIVKIVDAAGTGLANIEGFAMFVGKRAHWKWNIASGFSGKVFDGDGVAPFFNVQTQSLVGGVQVD